MKYAEGQEFVEVGRGCYSHCEAGKGTHIWNGERIVEKTVADPAKETDPVKETETETEKKPRKSRKAKK